MASYFAFYEYFCIVIIVALLTLSISKILPSKKGAPTKFLPYESGILTETALLQKRFPLHHFLVALVFLIFDIEVVFLFPWAVVGKALGKFAFFELLFFLIVLLIGYVYAWQKGGLEWEQIQKKKPPF